MTSSRNAFWTDLRSKRNITASHLTKNTYDDYQFYDPLLSPNVGVERVAPGIDWFSQARPNSWQLNLHSFRFADYWLLQYLRSGDTRILDRLNAVASDYLEKVWRQNWCKTAALKLSKNVAFKHVLSDTAVANRAAVFSFLLGRAHEGFPLSDQDGLRQALTEHVLHAAADEHYNSNNHGLFNDLHLLLGLINAPHTQVLRDVAPTVLARLLDTYLERQINDEGIHLEHTPSYSVLWVMLGRKILEVLEKLAELFPELAGEGADSVRVSMQLVTNNLWWFTKPDGELVNFGEQGRTDAAKWIPSDAFQPGIKLFRSAGYGFFKSDESYLGFVAAYHSTKAGRKGYRAASHKQRDELHLVWYDAGGDILVDPGLRAYDFGPERFYATSKAAHNTVCIGEDDFIGSSILLYMDKTAPYGGAIRCAESIDTAEGERWQVMLGQDPLLQLRNIFHQRALFLLPGRWLIVVDKISVESDQIAEWNFHLSERWKSTGYNKQGAGFKSDNGALRMTRYSNSPIDKVEVSLSVGGFSPVRGWRFSGGPVAVPNLYYREILKTGGQELRAHAFQLVHTLSSEKDGIASVDVRMHNNIFSVDMDLIDSGLKRSLAFNLSMDLFD